MKLNATIAARFVEIALSHVGREYPHKLDHVMDGDTDVQPPRVLHPVFHGSFDWHSCVHTHWMLARIMRRHPNLHSANTIALTLADRLTPDAVQGECAYVDRASARGFERPYGWAWLLALQAELDQHECDIGVHIAQTLRPLTRRFAERFAQFLPLADYPVRTGAHTSTAFALRLAADYAERNDQALFDQMREKAAAWYSADHGAQVWEPSQDDFLSPTLIEAECMRRYLSRDAFQLWFSNFLPNAAAGVPPTLFTPVRVSDRSDGKIAHLDGLNLSRAWCWRAIASAFDETHPLAERARQAAATHIDASIPHIAGDYMGEHWLATFATLSLDGL